MEKLHQDYREFLELLNAEKAEYIIIGAFAIAFHGHPRYTGDIDIWISNTKANAEKIYNSIIEFGFPKDNLSINDFTSNDLIFQMGYPPVRIDILTTIEALDFGKCFERKEIKKIDGLIIPYLSLNDLIKNKKSVGRKKDLADLELLRKK